MKTMTLTPLDAWMAAKLSTTGSILQTAELRKYQLDRLNAVIAQARKASPFYRKRLQGLPILNNIDQLATYPLTSAADLIAQGLKMLCVSQSQINRVVTLTTSGTEGEFKKVYFTAADQELTIDFFACGMSLLVGQGDRVLIFLPGERQGSVGDLLDKGLRRIEAEPVLYGFVDILPRAVRTLCEVKPDCLVGVPVQLLAMAHFCEKWQIKAWRPQTVLLSTDRVSNSIIAELKRVWGCEVFDHYGMTEMGLGGGLECGVHHGYHLREMDMFFEIVDKDTGQPLTEGQYGEVVFTTLTREGMPLIRYRTGDISRFIPEACPCGTSLRRLEKILARKGQIATLGPEQMLTMNELDDVLFLLPEVINIAAEVCFAEVVRLRIIVAVLSDTFDKQKILQALRRIPVINLLEAEKHLIIEVSILPWDENTPLVLGKRCLKITGNKRLAGGI